MRHAGIELDPIDAAGSDDRGLSDAAGVEGRRIWKLAGRGFPVVWTLLLRRGYFGALLGKELTARELGIAILETAGCMENPDSSLTIRPSLEQPLIGLPDQLLVGATTAEVEESLTFLADEWRAEKFQASRLSRGLSAAESTPALIIQRPVIGGYSLVTRAPATGERTSPSNSRDHIHNTVTTLLPLHEERLRMAEATLGDPAKLYFTNGDALYRVTDQPMARSGYLRFVREGHRDGLLSDIDAITKVQPEMLGAVTAYRPAAPEPVSRPLRGLNVAPGRCLAKWAVSPRSHPQSDPHVLVMQVWTPEHLERFTRAVGAIQLDRSGQTSHIAVVARGMGMPAVTGVDGLAISSDGTGLLVDGVPIKGEYVYLDGSEGTVQFCRERWMAPIYTASADTDVSVFVAGLVDRLVTASTFAGLSLSQQRHVASLQQRLARIREVANE